MASPAALAQKSKAQLEKEKKEIMQRISQNERILVQTSSQRRNTIGQLNALNSQIESQQNLISSISAELKLLEGQISEIGMIIESLEDDLESLKKEYTSMLYAAQKNQGSMNKLIFLFSAKNFNQMLMRLKYMEYYSEVRVNQVKQIEAVRTTLIGQKNVVEEKRFEQRSLFNEQVARNVELENLKDRQTKLVAELSLKEREIRKEIDDRKKAVSNLEKLIADIIKKEMEKSKARTDTRMGLTPDEKLISTNFEGNKKRLIWPVNAGFVSQKYGTHPHPVFKNIQTKNDGIDIQTNKDEPVRAIFEGVVMAVAAIPTFGTTVIVQHGDYLTVYANLKTASVKKDQKVGLKETIGIVATDKDGVSVLQFQVWKNTAKLNPEDWLAKK